MPFLTSQLRYTKFDLASTSLPTLGLVKLASAVDRVRAALLILLALFAYRHRPEQATSEWTLAWGHTAKTKDPTTSTVKSLKDFIRFLLEPQFKHTRAWWPDELLQACSGGEAGITSAAEWFKHQRDSVYKSWFNATLNALKRPGLFLTSYELAMRGEQLYSCVHFLRHYSPSIQESCVRWNTSWCRQWT
jgi:hypothetical protein